MSNDRYFQDHYSVMNSIDPASEASMQQWYVNAGEGYRRELSRYIGPPAGKRVLELGCGLGGTIRYLTSAGFTDVTGVDRSGDQLAVCRKYVSTNVHETDVFDFLTAATVRYDYVIALDLIEHLPKHRIVEFIGLVHAVLAPQGRFLVKTPNMAHPFGVRSRYIDHTHEVGFTEQSIAQVLRQGGFRTISVNDCAVGPRRLFAIRMYHRFHTWLFNVPRSHVLTHNLVAVADKE